MKRLKRILAGLMLGLALIIPVSLVTGGGCQNANQNAYRTVAVTQVSVQEALGLWNLYVAEKHPSIEQEQKVKDLFLKWQASMLLVCDAGKAFSGAGTTNAVPAAAFQTAVADAANKQAELIGTIRKFGVKL